MSQSQFQNFNTSMTQHYKVEQGRIPFTTRSVYDYYVVYGDWTRQNFRQGLSVGQKRRRRCFERHMVVLAYHMNSSFASMHRRQF